MKIFGKIIALLLVMALSACTASEDPAPQTEANISETAAGSMESAKTEGSFFSPNMMKEETLPKCSGYDAHPAAVEAKKIQRENFIPDNVKGKWKAVKILIRDKTDEEKNEIKTVELGTTFALGDGGMKVTVCPFFPNFVMDESHYTSMDNQLMNPAVQIVVEENGKNIYKGWAFENHPTLYAFENEKYGLQLMGSIAAEVS